MFAGWASRGGFIFTRVAAPHSSQRKRAASVRPLPAAKTPSFKYRPQFGLVIVCEDETHQRQTYERLTALGLAKIKVVVV